MYEIKVNGLPFAATKSLSVALLHLRDSTQDRNIWIDALGIDQGNDIEKSVELQRIRQIYACADRTIVLLGLCSPKGDHAVDCFNKLSLMETAHA